MTTRRVSPFDRLRLSRRKAIQLAGAGGAASALSGGFHLASGQEATPAIASDAIVIPDSGVALPEEDVTFRVLVQGPGPRTPFYNAFFEAYQEARPNITVQFDELPRSEVQQILPLSIQSGDAHDIFQLSGSATTANAVATGWVAPLDDVIPDFEAWKANFPPGVFLEGITVFDGKTYTFPLAANKRYGTLLFYNAQYLERAGIDPSEVPLSWEAFRSAAATLTKQGGGQYYGLVIGGDPGNLAEIVANLGTTAGAEGGDTLGGPMNWATGEYNFATDEYLAAIELLQGLQSDGSLFPGYLSMTEREASVNLPQGTAAMVLDGPWLIARWVDQYPEFQYGIGSQPLQDTGSFVPIGYPPGGANQHFLGADSELKNVAGDIFSYWGSPEGQAAFQSIVDGTLLAILPEARDNADLDEQSRKSRALFDKQMRLHPDPRARNPDVGKVYIEHRALQPDMGAIIQGVLSGQVSDVKAAMQDLKDRADAELERAIKAATDEGANVSRDDWVFPNWDPNKDYTDADYKELQG